MKQPLSQQELEQLIVRYFEAQTSEAEEAFLRKCLAYGKYDDTDSIVEAKAVLGFLAIKSTKNNTRNRINRRVISVAASVAVIITMMSIFATTYNRSKCEAYIAGVKTVDDAQIMDIVSADLNDIYIASLSTDSEIVGQLSDIKDAMDLDTDNLNDNK